MYFSPYVFAHNHCLPTVFVGPSTQFCCFPYMI